MTQDKSLIEQPTPPSKTIEQVDLTLSSQRKINAIWEITQAVIAIAITLAVIYNEINQIQSPNLINAFFLVVSMYLVRVNHTKIGGTGDKEGSR